MALRVEGLGPESTRLGDPTLHKGAQVRYLGDIEAE